MFGLFVLFVCISWVDGDLSIASRLSPEQQQRVLASRCRSFCISSLRKQKIETDAQCQQNPVCYQCWDTCLLFSDNFPIWGFMCDKRDVCFRGCRIACKVHDTKRPRHRKPSLKFEKPLKIEHNWLKGDLLIRWSTPVAKSKNRSPSFVYMLFWSRENSTRWTLLLETIERAFWTRNADILNGAHDFLLLAVGTDGVAAAQTWKGGSNAPFDEKSNQTWSDMNTSALWWSASVFIIGTASTAFLSGLIITLACIVVHRATAGWRRRRPLGRRYAFRHYPKLRRGSLTLNSEYVGEREAANLLRILPAVSPDASPRTESTFVRANRPLSLQFPTHNSCFRDTENFYTSTPQFEASFWDRQPFMLDRRMSETYTLAQSEPNNTYNVRPVDVSVDNAGRHSFLL